MARPVEKTLIAVTLAGILVVLIVSRSPLREPVVSTTTQTTLPVTTTTAPATTSTTTMSASSTMADDPDATTTATSSVRIPDTTEALGVEAGPGTTEAPATTTASPSTSLPATTEVPAAAATPPISSIPATTAATALASVPTSSTVSPTTSAPTTTAAELPRWCASVEQLWRWDGHSVEDPCTLAEVKRVLRWAWTGTDEQRRSAIRNGDLLDDVFAVLDDFGRTHDAGLFHPETREQWTVLYDNIRWHGGPEFDRAVIAVDFSFDHPDFERTPWWTDTLVQVDGKWRLSYRRSYCLRVTPILEDLDTEVRCPPDPIPDVNEDEYPDVIEEY